MIAISAAEQAMACKVPNWPLFVRLCDSEADLEAFRVTLLLQGRDTRSARRAIEGRRIVLSQINRIRKRSAL